MFTFIRNTPLYLKLAAHWLKFNSHGLNDAPSDRVTGLSSFQVYWILIPLGIVFTYIDQLPFFEHYHVSAFAYLSAQTIGTVIALVAAWGLVWLLAESQNLAERFWAFVVVSNCFNLLCTLLFSAPFIAIQESHIFTIKELQVLASILYIYLFVVQWFVAWKTLRCSPFLAMGFSIIVPMIATISSDFVDLKLYGTLRPNEQAWFVLNNNP